MYYIYSDIVYPSTVGRLIQQLLKLDRNEDIPFSEAKDDDCESSLNHQPKRCRKYSTHVLKVTPETFCKTLGVKFNNAKIVQTLIKNFMKHSGNNLL